MGRVGQVLSLSSKTVMRDWQLAKASKVASIKIGPASKHSSLSRRTTESFASLFRNLRHLRCNNLPSPIPFYEDSQVAVSSANSTSLYPLSGLGYGDVSVDLN